MYIPGPQRICVAEPVAFPYQLLFAGKDASVKNSGSQRPAWDTPQACDLESLRIHECCMWSMTFRHLQ